MLCINSMHTCISTSTPFLPPPPIHHPNPKKNSYGDATGQRREQFSVSALYLLGEEAATATQGDDGHKAKAAAAANAAFHNHLLKRLRWVLVNWLVYWGGGRSGVCVYPSSLHVSRISAHVHPLIFPFIHSDTRVTSSASSVPDPAPADTPPLL